MIPSAPMRAINGNAMSVVPLSQLGKTNTIGYNGAS
jgi:hypothetical protein